MTCDNSFCKVITLTPHSIIQIYFEYLYIRPGTSLLKNIPILLAMFEMNIGIRKQNEVKFSLVFWPLSMAGLCISVQNCNIVSNAKIGIVKPQNESS